ncbi:Ger(x)C family spore germination protein [Brevibacillus sp. SYSU BS000544]|uniref:Ger(x)C family spore germination protein n=1 Tax=Brevibacillus sp. SYSU BS000544 TaxID=3416443 RepID=UPI003CE5BAE9
MGLLRLILLLVVMIISGCSQELEKPTLEDFGFIGIIGLDYAGKDKFKVTATVPRPNTGQNQVTEFYQVVVPIYHEALPKLNRESDRTLTTTQLRVLLISKEFASKNGVARVIKALYRDPSIGDALLVAIVDGSCEKLLMQGSKENKTEINTFMNNLLRPRGDTDFIPFTTLQDLIFALTDETIDPVLPCIKYDEKDKKIRIVNIALFRDDKLVDTVSMEEGKILFTFFQHMTLTDVSLTIHETIDKGESNVVLYAIDSKNHIRASGSATSPKINILIKMKCSIIEYTGKKNLEDEDQVDMVEEAIAKEYERQVANLVNKLQKLRVDPMFLGEYVRSHQNKKNWSKEKWRNLFPKAKVTVDAHILVVSSGTIK